MRKLTPSEQHVINTLAKHGGSYCPGTDTGGLVMMQVKAALKSLAKKGRVEIEDTDDGPRYTLTAQGRADAI